MKSIVEGLFTREVDKNGVKIFFETSILKLSNSKLARIRFDDGQLAAYFSDENGFCIVDLEGVNNHKSYYLRDCEVVKSYTKEQLIKAMIWAENNGKHYVGTDKEGQLEEFKQYIEKL